MRESHATMLCGAGTMAVALFLLVLWFAFQRSPLLMASGLFWMTGACFAISGLLSARRESQRNGL